MEKKKVTLTYIASLSVKIIDSVYNGHDWEENKIRKSIAKEVFSQKQIRKIQEKIPAEEILIGFEIDICFQVGRSGAFQTWLVKMNFQSGKDLLLVKDNKFIPIGGEFKLYFKKMF